jgi:hypothetical protein
LQAAAEEIMLTAVGIDAVDVRVGDRLGVFSGPLAPRSLLARCATPRPCTLWRTEPFRWRGTCFVMMEAGI